MENIEGLIETRIALLRIELQEQVESWVKRAIMWTLVALMGFMLIGLLTVSLALFLGEALGKSYWGFLVVAGLYALLIGGLVLYLRKGNAKPTDTPENQEEATHKTDAEDHEST
ncbi:MAG: phage holin family protein [Bacteroidota bacterium]